MMQVGVGQWAVGQTVTKDVYNKYGVLLLRTGTMLNDSKVELLQRHRIELISVEGRSA